MNFIGTEFRRRHETGLDLCSAVYMHLQCILRVFLYIMPHFSTQASPFHIPLFLSLASNIYLTCLKRRSFLYGISIMVDTINFVRYFNAMNSVHLCSVTLRSN